MRRLLKRAVFPLKLPPFVSVKSPSEELRAKTNHG